MYKFVSWKDVDRITEYPLQQYNTNSYSTQIFLYKQFILSPFILIQIQTLILILNHKEFQCRVKRERRANQ